MWISTTAVAAVQSGAKANSPERHGKAGAGGHAKAHSVHSAHVSKGGGHGGGAAHKQAHGATHAHDVKKDAHARSSAASSSKKVAGGQHTHRVPEAHVHSHTSAAAAPRRAPVKPAAARPAPHRKLMVQAPASSSTSHAQHPALAQPHAMPPILG
jgi:hypothetical protein